MQVDRKNLQYSVETRHHNQRTQGLHASAIAEFGTQLPPRGVCDKLAVLYFDNMEHCFRVLHWPEFTNQLSILISESEPACNFGFVPQLTGVLPVAVLLGTHQECEAAAKCSAIKSTEAIRVMETFFSGLLHDERYRLAALQVKMLVLICKWLVPEPFDTLFRLGGELLSDASVMRMDQDPSSLQGISVFEREHRQRSWLTIFEVDLMLSILCKRPCLVPPYSSRPPRNVNDEELFEDTKALPASRPTDDCTDELCQFVLAQTIPRRVLTCSQLD